MSPKSKGRPKGRGRTPRRQPKIREIRPLDRVLRDARTLQSATRLSAQLTASAWLGEAWAARGMGERSPEASLVREVIGAAARGGKPAAYLALHALGTIPGEEWREDVASALEATDATHHTAPAWAGEVRQAEPEQPVRAQRWSDPWGSESLYVLHYDEPIAHSMAVHLGSVGGLFVHTISAGEQHSEMPDTIDALTLQGDVEVSEALLAVGDAMDQTDMYWPPQDSPDYVRCRAFAQWRTSEQERPERDWEPIPDEERQRLIDEFAGAHGLDLDPSVVEVLADTFIDFGDGYLDQGVLAWSPDEVERFLLDWAQRKVILEPECVAALPEVLREWVGFALRRRGLAEEHITPVQEAVDALAGEYLEGAGDEPEGPAAELMARLVAEGVDLEDQEAVSRVVGAYNAEQNARRLLDR